MLANQLTHPQPYSPALLFHLRKPQQLTSLLMNYFATRLEMHELEILHMLEDFAISIKYAIHLVGN